MNRDDMHKNVQSRSDLPVVTTPLLHHIKYLPRKPLNESYPQQKSASYQHITERETLFAAVCLTGTLAI